MDFTPWLATAVIAVAVAAVLRGLDVRLALLVAALALGTLAGDPAPIVREFLATFSNERFVVPICSAMGFAFVLKHTGCDRHLVRVLMGPVRRVRVLTVPGVVGVGFLVNIPVISQTSTAVCLGTVVVPVMRAAGFGPVSTGACLLLGASVGGELLNPGAPELLTVQTKTGVSTLRMRPVLLPLVLTVLGVSAVALWVTEGVRRGGADRWAGDEPASANAGEPLNPFRAAVPLVPLAILFVSGPPLDWLSVPQRWVVNRPAVETAAAAVGNAGAVAGEAKKDASYSTRLIGLAMLVGVGVAAAAAPDRSNGCVRAFFDGAGYGFTQVISLIVTANCFGKGIEAAGLSRHLGALIGAEPGLLQPLAGAVPAGFAFVCGSGIASTQSLYGFFHGPAVAAGQDPVAVGALVSVGSAVGRTMSPVAAVTLMVAALTGTSPFALARRVAGPLLVGLAAVIGLRLAGAM